MDLDGTMDEWNQFNMVETYLYSINQFNMVETYLYIYIIIWTQMDGLYEIIDVVVDTS